MACWNSLHLHGLLRKIGSPTSTPSAPPAWLEVTRQVIGRGTPKSKIREDVTAIKLLTGVWDVKIPDCSHFLAPSAVRIPIAGLFFSPFTTYTYNFKTLQETTKAHESDQEALSNLNTLKQCWVARLTLKNPTKKLTSTLLKHTCTVLSYERRNLQFSWLNFRKKRITYDAALLRDGLI